MISSFDRCKAEEAAEGMDWQQVVLNGGPPCFHLEPNGNKFCGRAERWAGHDGKSHHDFVPLHELMNEMYWAGHGDGSSAALTD